MKKIIVIFALFVFTSCFAQTILNISYTPLVDYPEVENGDFEPESYNVGIKYINLGGLHNNSVFNLGYSTSCNFIYSSDETKEGSYEISNESTTQQIASSLQIVPSIKANFLDESKLYLYSGIGFDIVHTDYNMTNNDKDLIDDDDLTFGLAYSLGVKMVFNTVSFDVCLEHLENEPEFKYIDSNLKQKIDFASNSLLFSIGFEL